VLIIVTEWEQFRALDLDRLKRTMADVWQHGRGSFGEASAP